MDFLKIPAIVVLYQRPLRPVETQMNIGKKAELRKSGGIGTGTNAHDILVV